MPAACSASPTSLPGHYGTFPLLAGTPAQLRDELASLGLAETVRVHAPAPGETVA